MTVSDLVMIGTSTGAFGCVEALDQKMGSVREVAEIQRGASIFPALFNFGDLAHAGGIGFGQIHDFEQCLPCRLARLSVRSMPDRRVSICTVIVRKHSRIVQI